MTETGRQPWIIYRLLRTADAVAPVAAGAVATTLLIFFALYNLLLLAFFWFAGRLALKGPVDSPPPSRERPGIDRTNTGLIAPVAGAERPAAPQQAGA